MHIIKETVFILATIKNYEFCKIYSQGQFVGEVDICKCVLSLSYIPLYVHLCPGYSYYCDFITEFRGCRDHAMAIDMHLILCVFTVWLQMHPSVMGMYERIGHMRSPV